MSSTEWALRVRVAYLSPMQVEIGHLDRRYAPLRVLDAGRVARLAASMASEGQKTPVLLAAEAVLVDGYHRVGALERLGEDLVEAVELALGGAEALILAWRLETGRRKSALEEGWLLLELATEHGRTVKDLATDMGRTRSWVSERLGLARALPAEVQEAVRTLKIPPAGALKCLVPMARRDPDGCAALARALTEPISRRELERLAGAWRKADAAGRSRIVENPGLFLRVDAEVAPVLDAEEKLARDLESVAGLCGRARRAVREGAFPRGNGPAGGAWVQAREAFDALKEEVERGRS